MWWGELSSECGVSCLLNGASCLLNVGRVVLGRVFFGASCLGASCLWGELSVIPSTVLDFTPVKFVDGNERKCQNFSFVLFCQSVVLKAMFGLKNSHQK